MRINTINTSNYMTAKAVTAVPYPEYPNAYKTKAASFGHTAVPYPEYEKAYYADSEKTSSIKKLTDRIFSLYTPEVTKKSQEIKRGIDKIYNGERQGVNYSGVSPQKQLLSVFA